MTTSAVPKGNAYDKYASPNPVEVRLMRGFLRCLGDLLPRDAPEKILEVGLGEGEISERVRDRFPLASMVGIDLPDEGLAGAWRERKITGMFADISRLPFADASFDLVMGIEVLEHVPDPRAALEEIARVAREHVLLSVPREPIWRVANLARGRYVRALGNTPGHVQHWSRRQFANLVAEQFDPIAVRSPFPWTFVSARPRPHRPSS
jgi:ubiquinone/menaquinone biosynthesis C-methylase UbiE